MIIIPDGSIYFWMFTQGLKQVPLDSILAACNLAGKDVRSKDIDNYWNGWYKSGLKKHRSILEFGHVPQSKDYFIKDYKSYPIHPFLGQPEIQNRFIPTYSNGMPLIQWKDGCLDAWTAMHFAGGTYVSENLQGTKTIVIDIDGDHGGELDMETIDFGYLFTDTHTLFKPKHIPDYEGYEAWKSEWNKSASFHLTFRVDRLIPTMHFPKAHIDILGNQKNTLRCYKNKVWNKKEPIDMTPDIWDMIKAYIRKREEE